MKRLFIESDTLDQAELNTAKRRVYMILDKNKIHCSDEVFDEIKDFAWHEGVEAWEAVKRCDEIYAMSGLIPLLGYGSYTGAPVVMDRMMQAAVAENITGKSVIFLRKFADIDWNNIDLTLLDKAFRKNFLFTLEEKEFVQVDIDKILRKCQI